MYEVSRVTYKKIMDLLKEFDAVPEEKTFDSVADDICKVVETEVNVGGTFAKQVQSGVSNVGTLVGANMSNEVQKKIAIRNGQGFVDETGVFVPTARKVEFTNNI